MNSNDNYHINRSNDGFPVYELVDARTDSKVVLCPERGGIVTSCRLRGIELLYLDRDTFLNPQANIRGGIPVLFPIAGQLVNGEYEWNGQTYRMKNHGVARLLPWEVIETNTENEASVAVALHSNSETLAAYPFEFELRFTYKLQDGILYIDQQYKNLSEQAMPMVAGFHPYFATEGKNLAYGTDATRILDYNDKKEKPFDGTLNLETMVESAALLDATRPQVTFPLAQGRKVKLSYSEQFRYVVLWSVEGKPFVCVEPWTALNEALNDKEGLLMVSPGHTQSLTLNISCE
ncbi:aldose epimerase [Cohnella lupini]|uniref:Galactose mutarotase-like enzyme n=1 Tax=Cohnella lupini TaxID=1294267 RepID=A0A3D9ISJ9_9BACL|nr:aldose epimerase [Cohnella lupini]RED64655.1 galactose mutarotase-like enzyme [Cohnella lupini]